jgi:hypothetical protein
LNSRANCKDRVGEIGANISNPPKNTDKINKIV